MKPALPGAFQAGFVAMLLAAIPAMAVTAHDNLTRQGIATGFRFLFDRTGWDVGSSFIEHGPGDRHHNRPTTVRSARYDRRLRSQRAEHHV